jgi:hypothetical protein
MLWQRCALFDSRDSAWPGRRRLGNGEGEFSIVEALLCLTEAQRPGGVEVQGSGEPKLLNLRERRAVPIARYFIIVGGALAALLFIAGWCLPTPPAMFAGSSVAIDRAVIRIKSAHKWPEKIVLDTSQPTTALPAVEEPPAAQLVRLPPDEAQDQSKLEAMALLKLDTQPAAIDHPTLRIKRGLARTARSKRVARGPVTPRLARAETGGGCCQFGWIDNGQTSSNAMPRRQTASSWPMNWPALTGSN